MVYLKNNSKLLSPTEYYNILNKCHKNKRPVSYQPSYFCCNLNCKGCNATINKDCIKQLKKKVYISSGNSAPSIIKVQEQGANAYNKLVWLIQNIEYGNASIALKCNCNQYNTFDYKKNKYNIKHCTNCNNNKGCNKLNNKYRKECLKYLKVYNTFGDINYNTVDGWPPLGANNTSDFRYNPNYTIPKEGQAPTQSYNDYIQYKRFINLQWLNKNNTSKKNLNKFFEIMYNYKYNDYINKNKKLNKYINNIQN